MCWPCSSTSVEAVFFHCPIDKQTAHDTGTQDDTLTDGYPWSWPRPIPSGSEIECEFTRDTLRIAEALGQRRFFRDPDRVERVQDAVSQAWVLLQQPTYRERGHPGSIAAIAVKRVASHRHFAESQTSLQHPQPQHHQLHRRRPLWDHLGSEKTVHPQEGTQLRLDLLDWLDTLTVRQREVALLLATGHTTREIADRSDCTTNAVRMIRSVLRQRYEEFLRESMTGEVHRESA